MEDGFLNIGKPEVLKGFLAHLSLAKLIDVTKFGIYARCDSKMGNYYGFQINFRHLKSLSFDYESYRWASCIDFSRMPSLHWLYERPSYHHPTLPLAGVLHDRSLMIILKSGRLFRDELNFFPPEKRTCDGLNFLRGGPLPLRGTVLNVSRESSWDSVYHFASLSYRNRTDDYNPDLTNEFAQNYLCYTPICQCPQL